MSNAELSIIIPTTRLEKAILTIQSAFKQVGFDSINVVITGKSTLNTEFGEILNQAGLLKENLHIVKCKDKEKVLPGEARNDGLRYINTHLQNTSYILMLDDDIIIPTDYCTILLDYINEIDSCATLGRISSRPINFWTQTIDYSNFWWAQTEIDNKDIGWLSTTATFVKYEYIRDLYFDDNVAVNEDVIFFNEVKRRSGKTLSICARTMGEHHHNRKNFSEFAKYQFTNGKRGVLFHYDNGISLRKGIKNFWGNFNASTNGNRLFLNRHFLTKIGVFFSFIIFEIGIQRGSYLKKHGRKFF